MIDPELINMKAFDRDLLMCKHYKDHEIGCLCSPGSKGEPTT